MPAIISSVVIEATIVIVVKVCGYQKRWIKYFVMSCCILAITSFGIFYTYHSILLSVLPLFYAIQYTDKKVLRLTMILSILSIFFVVMEGYYWGLCDANMLLLTIGRTKEYIDPITGGLKFIEVNTNPWISLPLFYIFPRCVVLCFFVPVIKVVSQHITKSAYREQEIIIRSEYDEMTGLYNRNKFNEMVMEYYPTLDEIGKHINELIKEADLYMYEDKRKLKQK